MRRVLALGLVAAAVLLPSCAPKPAAPLPEGEDYVLYASHSIWASRAAFEAWTESEHFRKAHAQASAPKGTYLGHPNLETFEQVL